MKLLCSRTLALKLAPSILALLLLVKVGADAQITQGPHDATITLSRPPGSTELQEQDEELESAVFSCTTPCSNAPVSWRVGVTSPFGFAVSMITPFTPSYLLPRGMTLQQDRSACAEEESNSDSSDGSSEPTMTSTLRIGEAALECADCKIPVECSTIVYYNAAAAACSGASTSIVSRSGFVFLYVERKIVAATMASDSVTTELTTAGGDTDTTVDSEITNTTEESAVNTQSPQGMKGGRNKSFSKPTPTGSTQSTTGSSVATRTGSKASLPKRHISEQLASDSNNCGGKGDKALNSSILWFSTGTVAGLVLGLLLACLLHLCFRCCLHFRHLSSVRKTDSCHAELL